MRLVSIVVVRPGTEEVGILSTVLNSVVLGPAPE